MSFTTEQARRMIPFLLENSVSIAEQTSVARFGGKNLIFTQQPIELLDEETGRTLYALVHVFVAPNRNDVTALAGALERMHVQPPQE